MRISYMRGEILDYWLPGNGLFDTKMKNQIYLHDKKSYQAKANETQPQFYSIKACLNSQTPTISIP